MEDPVVCLEVGVPIDLPPNLYTWPIADEAGAARSRRYQQKSGNRIDAVAEILSPLKEHVRRNSHSMRQLSLNSRMEINEIHRTWSRISENSEIVANWEHR